MTADAHLASDRRLRVRGRGTMSGGLVHPRQFIGVRYPWERWGSSTYSHRSFLGLDVEPNYTAEPSPARLANTRRMLTTKNSRREILKWKHTHQRNNPGTETATGEHSEQIRNVIDAAWWNYEGMDLTGITHPVVSGEWDGVPYCPSPISEYAIFAHYYENVAETQKYGWILRPFWNVTLSPPGWDFEWRWEGHYIRELTIFDNPGEISAAMDWTDSHNHADDVMFRMNRKCERALIYRGVEHDGESLDIDTAAPDYILRQVASDGGGYVYPPGHPNEGDPVYPPRQNIDNRWQPFGWTDAVDYESQSTPALSPTDFGTVNGDRRAGWQVDTSISGRKSIRPPSHASAIDDWDDCNFSTSDLTRQKVSAARLFSMMMYNAQPLARMAGPAFTTMSGGHARIPAGRKFDLIVFASFYRYKLWKWKDESHYNEDTEELESEWEDITPADNFAGTYGKAYAIY